MGTSVIFNELQTKILEAIKGTELNTALDTFAGFIASYVVVLASSEKEALRMLDGLNVELKKAAKSNYKNKDEIIKRFTTTLN